MGRKANSVDRMLITSVVKSPSCWHWTGQLQTNGYGKTSIKSTTQLAHRLFYEHFKGPIPDRFQINHTCRNRACVNPGHLEAVTAAVNVSRSDSPHGLNGRKVFCDHGHKLAGPNLYVTPDGRRQCRTCRAISSSAAKFKKG